MLCELVGLFYGRVEKDLGSEYGGVAFKSFQLVEESILRARFMAENPLFRSCYTTYILCRWYGSSHDAVRGLVEHKLGDKLPTSR